MGIFTSPDGITWTSRTLPAIAVWQSITYGNGLFVAVSFNVATYSVMTSPNGITWTARVPSTTGPNWDGVTYGNGLFVAVSTLNGIMTSPDGINWTNINAANLLGSVVYGNGLFVAMGAGSAFTSPDGINWTKRDFPLTNGLNTYLNFWPSVTYANGIFVAVSNSNTNSISTKVSFVITSGALGVLAVHWLNVNCTLSSTSNAQISWKVSEENVKNYAIEKSNDGTHYNGIANIASKGNGENSYVFTEANKLTADAWYRIRQTDNDGKNNYSSTVFITAKSSTKIKIYPNPAHETVTINVSNALLNKTARLTNMDGKVLQTIRITNLSTTINVAGYSEEVYLLKIENEAPIKISKQ